MTLTSGELQAQEDDTSRSQWRLFVKISLVVLLLLPVMIYFMSDATTYGRIAAGLLSQSLNSSEVGLEITNPELHGLNLKGDALLFEVKNSALTLEARNPSLKMASLAVLSNTLQGNLTAFPYSGTLTSDFKVETNKDTQSYNVLLENVQLNQSRFIRVFGINEGILNCEIQDLQLLKGVPVKGTVDLKITDLARSFKDVVVDNAILPGTNYTSNFVNQSLNLVLPKIRGLNISAQADFSPETAMIKSASIILPFGQIKAEGKISDLSGFATVQMKISGLLNARGVKKYGSLLRSLIPSHIRNQRIAPDAKSMTIEGILEGPLARPQWRWLSVE